MTGVQTCALPISELGTYIHGLSGDLAKFEKGVYSVMARDLIEYISKALMKLEEE